MAHSFSRSLYRCLLGLHPPSFQREFADEMLWIFDKLAAKQSPLPLFGDGLVSLARQWVLRGASRSLFAGEIALAPAAGHDTGPLTWEHIGVPEAPLPVSRMIQGSAIALLFLAMLSFAAFRPVRSRTLPRVSAPSKMPRQAPGHSQPNGGAPSDGAAPGSVGSSRITSNSIPGDRQDHQASSGEAVAAQAEAPSTPAARQFQAWLDAFNSGDRSRLLAFLEKNYPDHAKEIDGELRFRNMTGGFDFKKAGDSEAAKFSGILKEHDSDQFARFTMEVDPAEPHHITKFDLDAIARPAEFPMPRMSEDQAVAALRTEIDRQVAADRFAGAVIVSKHGKPIFSKAYGLSDREKKTANELNTRFRIGSMNKMFTAVSVLQLAQNGKIKLTAPLGEYLPDYPNKDVAAKVTIHHLLTHTGGTGDFFGPEFDAHRLELRTLQDYVKLYGKRGLEFEPGSKWSYSNYGFLLLGVLVEKVSGQNYYDYVRDHVYRPAGMTSTGSLPEDQAVPQRSVGYTKFGGGETWRPNTDTLPYRGTSAGGGYSTVEDLQRFADALANRKLLDAHHTELLTTGKTDTGNGDKYAYGFMDRTQGGVRNFGHGGGAPGMNGELAVYPQSGYVVTVLANLDPPSAGRIAAFIGNRLPEK
jgi:D-alanyl-D-alanine carboxypeptidase